VAQKKVVVGLGNPGSRYEKTRHNIGWLVLDRLADRIGSVGRAKARDGAASVRGRLDDDELILVKPTTYMNLSGTAVRKALARERIPLDDLLIVVDDMALPFGKLRMRARGSDGGHNGLRSIIAELGTAEFARLRLGIGGPADGVDKADFVLEPLEGEAWTGLESTTAAAAEAVGVAVVRGLRAAMDAFNREPVLLPESRLSVTDAADRPPPAPAGPA
jgi:PTH1 family peptidyl-tRNA hydrolase